MKLNEAFQTVGRRLPIILDTLRTCKDHLEPIKDTLAVDICEALEKIVEACDDKASRLRQIFEKSLPGDNDGWEKRYPKVVTRLGKGNKVDAQLMVTHHAVKSAKPEQQAKLEKIIEEMRSVESSIPEEKSASMSFSSGGGSMENYINKDKGTFVGNRDRVHTQTFGNGKN